MLKGLYLINTNIYNKKAHTIQISKTIEAINKTGTAKVILVAPNYSNRLNLDWFYDYYGISRKFDIRLIFNFWRKNGTILSFILFDFTAIFYVFYAKFFKKADFIYFRSEYFLPLAVAAKILSLPYYYEIHRKGLNRIEEKIKIFLAKNATGLVVITNRLKDYYQKINENIITAYDSVDIGRFGADIAKEEARKTLNLEKEKMIFTYCGSIRKGKGVETILEAALKFPDCGFYLVGRVNPLFVYIAEKYKSDNIHFVGEVPNTKVPFYLKASDLLILPHLSNLRSQSPMKLFEYMASGGVILSSDLENIREILSDKDALFFKAGDTEDFCSKIRKFKENPFFYSPMGQNAKDKARNFTWEKRGEKISALITKQNDKF